MNLTNLLSSRQTNGLIAFIGLALISIALIMQEIFGMHPCPLCITQRIFVILTGVIAFIALIHNPSKPGLKTYAVLGLASACAGAGFSGRHIWLQNLPDDLVPACGPGLNYMFENFPIMEAFQLLLMGDGNCSEVVWSLFGITIPGWLLIGFVGLAALNIWQIARKN